VLDALHDGGIAPLLFKGTALAYTHYPEPPLRPRFDTDVLIDAAQVDLAGATLERLGYTRRTFTSGELVTYQVPYGRTDHRGLPHTIDVHWRVSNPQVFAAAFTIEELRARSINIDAFGKFARAAGPEHALALASIHRVAHHSDEDRLIWIYDIHLIAEGLSAPQQDEFVNVARAKHLTAVCAAGLTQAQEKFRGRGAAALVARLRESLSDATTPTRDRSEIYANGRMRKVDVLISDLKALNGWRPKMKLLREHVLPPASYMRQTYGVTSTSLLPVLYVWRFVRGAKAWWRRGP
jgi:hypothetical protein